MAPKRTRNETSETVPAPEKTAEETEDLCEDSSEGSAEEALSPHSPSAAMGASCSAPVKTRLIDPLFTKALSIKTGAQHTSAIGKEGQYAKFIAVNMDAIPCTNENFVGEFIFNRFCIVAAVASGFSKVPYTKKDGVSKDAKPMSQVEMNPQTKERYMRMWTFTKSNKQTDRGPRCDDVSWTIRSGDVITVIMNKDALSKGGTPSNDKGPASEPFPGHVSHIPPFSVLEIMVACKNHDSVTKERGDAIRVSHISFSPLSMISYLMDLKLIPHSMENAVKSAEARRNEDPIVSCFSDTNTASFFTPVTSGCICFDKERVLVPPKPVKHAEDEGVKTRLSEKMLTLTAWTDGTLTGLPSETELDMPLSAVMVATNAIPVNHIGEFVRAPTEQDIEWATTMLTIASDFGALNVFVCTNTYWGSGGKSPFRGIPIIDTNKILAEIAPPIQNQFPDNLTLVKGESGNIYDYKTTSRCNPDVYGIPVGNMDLSYRLSINDTKTKPAEKLRPTPEMLSSDVEELKKVAFGPPSGDLIICRTSVPGEGYNVQVRLPDPATGEYDEIATFRLRMDTGITPHGVSSSSSSGPVKRMRFGAVKG